MTLSGEMSRAIETMPSDASLMRSEDFRTLSARLRAHGDALSAVSAVLRRYQRKRFKRLARLELEELRAALLSGHDCVRAWDVYDEWYRSSGLGRVVPRLAESYPKEVRTAHDTRKMLAEFGDPTLPEWRPGWRASLRASLGNAHNDAARRRG